MFLAQRGSVAAGLLLVLAAAAAAACSTAPAAPAAGSPAASAATSTGGAIGSAGTGSVEPTPTQAQTASPGVGAVDLVITGARSATVRGSAGCAVQHTATGDVFGWQAGERDYPELYDGLLVGEARGASGNSLVVKWVVRGSITYENGAPIPYSGDGHSVTLDDDLTGVEGSVHVKGTISCP